MPSYSVERSFHLSYIMVLLHSIVFYLLLPAIPMDKETEGFMNHLPLPVRDWAKLPSCIQQRKFHLHLLYLGLFNYHLLYHLIIRPPAAHADKAMEAQALAAVVPTPALTRLLLSRARAKLPTRLPHHPLLQQDLLYHRLHLLPAVPADKAMEMQMFSLVLNLLIGLWM